jgi:UDP-glucose 4-epimerase
MHNFVPLSLVTGGAGFIGSHVAEQCLRMGHQVVALDDLSGGRKENIPDGARFVHGSITDDTLVRRLFSEFEFHYVYHLAAYAAEGLSHFIRRFNYANNLIGTVTLINAAIRAKTVRRFVFTSSIAVYGAAQVPMTEEITPMPEDPYGISKYAAELDLHSAKEMFDLEFTVFRPHNVYGDRQNIGDRYRNVIGIFINQVMKDEAMSVFGDGLQTRAFTHVDDVAPIIAQCVDMQAAANRTFNIGADRPYTILELAETVALAFEVPARIRHLEKRNEVVHAFASHAALESVFGEPSRVPLEEGIRRMADWAKRVGPRSTPPFDNIEIHLNLPPSWAAPGTALAPEPDLA